MYGVIYAYILNKETKYIGQTTNIASRQSNQLSNARNRNSKEYNYPLSRGIRKHGFDAFKIKIIDRADTLEELNKKEVYWIEYYKTYSSQKGYNQRPGGNNDNSHQFEISEDAVDKIISLLKKGTTYKEIERITNVSQAHISGINTGSKRKRENVTYPIQSMTRGRKITDESCLNIIKLIKETKMSYEEIAELYNVSGSLISDINRGKFSYLPEDDYPIREIKKVKKLSEEEVKEIVCDLENSCDSIAEIARRKNRSGKTITEINQGRHRYNPKSKKYPIRK